MQNESPPSQQYSVLVDESSSPSAGFSLARSSRRVKVLAALLGVAIVCAVGVGGYCGAGKCSASTNNNNAHQTNEAAIPSAPSGASAPSVPAPIPPPSPAPVPPPPPPASPSPSPSAPPSSAPKDPSASSWTEVLTLDCNGALHGLASQGLLKMFAFTPLIKGLLNQLHDAVINDAKYHCPSISAQEIADHFDVNVGSLLGLLQAGYVRVPLSCNNNPKTSFEVSLESFQNQVNFSLPATCSPASWQTGQTCFMQYAFDSTATLRLGASACPNSHVPFVSLQCSGVMCNQLVRPCQYDSDCDSGVNCTQIVDPSSVRDAFLQFLQRDTAWYINSDPSNQCQLPGGGYLTDQVVGSFALEELMSFWGSFTQLADPTHVSGLQVCGWGNIQNYTNWFSNCSTSADGITSCPSLSAWNGISDSGEPINSPNRMSGQAFSPPQPVPTPQNPKVVTLVNWTESVFYALPNTRFAYTARTPDYSSILQQASSIMQAVLSCKNGSVFNMGINEFQSRLVPWTGLMHLFGLTVHDAPSPPFSPLPEGNIDYENTAFVHGDQGAGLIWNAFQSVWPVAAEFVNDLINNAYISPYPLNYYISEYLTSALNPIDFLLEVIRSIISGAGVSGGMFGLNFESIFLEAATNVKLFMVDGCTYADVVATGECRFQYEGVRTALGLDATLRAVVTRSARNPNGLPNIVIDCVGSDCVTLATLGDSTFGAEPCYQNGDCASGSCGLLGSDTELVFPDFIPTVLWGGSGQSNIQQFSINFNGNLQQQDIAKVTNAIQNSFNGFFSYNVSGVIGNVDLVSTLVATNTLSFTAYPTSSVAASNVGEAYGTFWACYYGQPTIQYLIDIIQNSGASVTFNSCQPLGTLPMYYSPNLSPPWGLTMDMNYVSQNTWEWFNLIRSTLGYAPLQPDLTRVPGVCKPPIFTFIQNAASGFDFNAFYTGTFPIYNNVMKMTDLEPYKGDQ